MPLVNSIYIVISFIKKLEVHKGKLMMRSKLKVELSINELLIISNLRFSRLNMTLYVVSHNFNKVGLIVIR